MPSLTVIISIKKRYDALSEALKSIARQTVKPQEIIVVDQTPKTMARGMKQENCCQAAFT